MSTLKPLDSHLPMNHFWSSYKRHIKCHPNDGCLVHLLPSPRPGRIIVFHSLLKQKKGRWHPSCILPQVNRRAYALKGNLGALIQNVTWAAFSIETVFANVSQQSCTKERKFCKTFSNVSILNAALGTFLFSLRIAGLNSLCRVECGLRVERAKSATICSISKQRRRLEAIL